MRRSGIENASKEPSAVNPAMDQNAMRKALEISACSKICSDEDDAAPAPCSIMAAKTRAVSGCLIDKAANRTVATIAVPNAAPIDRETWTDAAKMFSVHALEAVE